VTTPGASPPGDRVIVCSTISCGVCAQCRAGNTAQCDVANANGPAAGTAFFGGPESTGPVDGLRAEYARIPWASHTLIALPDAISDEQAILPSDIFSTAWFGVELAGVRRGDTVAVFGAGIVGQLAIASAFRQGAGRVFSIDGIETRLAQSLSQNAEIIDFNADSPPPCAGTSHIAASSGSRVYTTPARDPQRTEFGVEARSQGVADCGRQPSAAKRDAQPRRSFG
jgi:threonine dehydrogenase-like Zn-dependent dehydrogenase